MLKEFRSGAPVVVSTVNVSDRGARELCVSSIGEAAKVYAVHPADRRFGAYAEAPYATLLAEIVFVLLGIEEIFRQGSLSSYETKSLGFRYGGPKSRATANRAVAAVGALCQVQIRLELDSATVAAAMVSFLHDGLP